MENLVISTKYLNAFVVKYPYGASIDFFASSPQALADGLKKINWAYKPDIFLLETWHKTPKFKKLSNKEIESIVSNY